MLPAARHALRRAGLAARQQGLLHRMEDCAAAVNGSALALWPRATADSSIGCSLLVPQPGLCSSRSLCITAESGSRHTSGAQTSLHGPAADGHASHQAASSSGGSGSSAEETAAADEDAEADARADETRHRILDAALRHVVRTVRGLVCWQLEGLLVCWQAAGTSAAQAYCVQSCHPHTGFSAPTFGVAGQPQQTSVGKVA